MMKTSSTYEILEQNNLEQKKSADNRLNKKEQIIDPILTAQRQLDTRLYIMQEKLEIGALQANLSDLRNKSKSSVVENKNKEKDSGIMVDGYYILSRKHFNYTAYGIPSEIQYEGAEKIGSKGVENIYSRYSKRFIATIAGYKYCFDIQDDQTMQDSCNQVTSFLFNISRLIDERKAFELKGWKLNIHKNNLTRERLQKKENTGDRGIDNVERIKHAWQPDMKKVAKIDNNKLYYWILEKRSRRVTNLKLDGSFENETEYYDVMQPYQIDFQKQTQGIFKKKEFENVNLLSNEILKLVNNYKK